MSDFTPPPFRPAWWLPGPHLPTIWGKFGRRQPMVHDRLERWSTPDGDHLTLARVGTPRPGVPHLLLLHGLEGKLTAKYAHGLLGQAKARGWSGDLMLFRSCDGEMNSARRMYHSGETTDVDFVVRRLIAENPETPLCIAGVSLGGNVTLKWLGEQGADVPWQVVRAAAVSTPFDLEAGSRFLERGFSRQYVRHFLQSLTAKTLAKMERYPDLCDRERLLACRTFFDFDDAVTGPVHGFSGAKDYYTRSSSIRFIENICVPTLLLSAEDDPFLPREVLERVREIAARNSYLRPHFTARGGHVGWVEGHPAVESYYIESALMSWFEARLNGFMMAP
jgi:predicted alpha/beta-fold hydrolase